MAASHRDEKVIVILLGRKDAGKGTVAKILAEHFDGTKMDHNLDHIPFYVPSIVPRKFAEMALATHLKQVVSVLFGWKLELLEGATEESRKWREEPDPVWSERLGKPIIPRHMLVRVGTTMVRHFISDIFWLASLDAAIANSPANIIVIPDGRLIVEYDYFIKNYKNVIICSIESNRAIAPYRDMLKDFIQTEKVRLLPMVDRLDYVVRLDVIEAFLEGKNVFNDEAEISEWQTVLLQVTDLAYLTKKLPPHKIIKMQNDGTKEDLTGNCHDIIFAINKCLLE